jgi:dipeptidase E
MMKLLLTSGGVKNPTIYGALVDLLPKPIADSSALCIPTAEYGHSWCTPRVRVAFRRGQGPAPMCDLGWKSLGLLEFTALPTFPAQRWMPWIKQTAVTRCI